MFHYDDNYGNKYGSIAYFSENFIKCFIDLQCTESRVAVR